MVVGAPAPVSTVGTMVPYLPTGYVSNRGPPKTASRFQISRANPPEKDPTPKKARTLQAGSFFTMGLPCYSLVWMDELLHHFATMGSHCLLVCPGQSYHPRVLERWCAICFVHPLNPAKHLETPAGQIFEFLASRFGLNSRVPRAELLP